MAAKGEKSQRFDLFSMGSYQHLNCLRAVKDKREHEMENVMAKLRVVQSMGGEKSKKAEALMRTLKSETETRATEAPMADPEVESCLKVKTQSFLPHFGAPEDVTDPSYDFLMGAPKELNRIFAPSPARSGTVTGSGFPRDTWALTFDDGPHPLYTEQIRQNLVSFQMPATFFWLAMNVKTAWGSALVKAVRETEIGTGEDNHRLHVANHSYTHANLPRCNEIQLDKEINQAAAVQTEFYGSQPTLFRCPYGACSAAARVKIANLQMLSALWNVDSLDWQDKNSDSIFNRVVKQIEVQKGGIILFHDIHPQSVEASRKVMAYLASKSGVRVVSLPDVISELNREPFFSP